MFQKHAVGFQFISDLPFLTLKGIGHHLIESQEYFWDNRKRPGEYCLIQYCIKGEGALEVNGIHYPVLPGQAFVIEIPGESRYYLPSHSAYWEVLYLEFSRECLPLMRKIYRSAGPVFSLSEESGLVEQMFSIHEKALKNELKTFFENTKAAYLFWMDFASYALTCTDRKISKIDHAKMYIDQNYYRNELNLDMVAEHAGLSKCYMCKEFHNKYGVAPGRYLKELRIFHACRLLSIHADLSLQDIACMVGYSNDNYFGKVFKAVKGVTPDAFRKQNTHYDFVHAVYETL